MESDQLLIYHSVIYCNKFGMKKVGGDEEEGILRVGTLALEFPSLGGPLSLLLFIF